MSYFCLAHDLCISLVYRLNYDASQQYMKLLQLAVVTIL